MINMYIELPIVLLIISLVYSATRYEEWKSIFQETIRWGWKMAAFLLSIAGVLYIFAIFNNR